MNLPKRKIGCVAYSQAKRDNPNDIYDRPTCDNQGRGLPANRFSFEGEEHFEQDKPWKQKRTFLHCNDDEESKNCSTHQKARRSRWDPQFSWDSTNSLRQNDSSDLSSEDEEIQDDQDINSEDYNYLGG